ncbi:MAG: Zn-ribbon domain-containing OB-fold protein [Candidatus Binatia bacterium]
MFRLDGDGPRLLAARCVACDRLQFPAAASCPYCGEDGSRETAVGPDARLFLFTAITSPPPGYRGPLPYGFGIVELPEGLRVVTRLTESDVTRLHVDQAMRLVVEPLFSDEDGTPVLSFAFGPCA